MALFPTAGVEILDGLPKSITSNKFAVEQDNKAFDGGLKSSVEWKHEETDLTIRVFDTSMSAVIDFLEDNRHELNQFDLPGYTPFNRTSTDNYGYCKPVSAPKRISPRLWEMVIHVIWRPAP